MTIKIYFKVVSIVDIYFILKNYIIKIIINKVYKINYHKPINLDSTNYYNVT